jgi:hypothetical protein
MDVGGWLNRWSLGHYAEAFAKHGIDGERLKAMTSEDLKALGVTPISHRKTILRAIAELKGGKKDVRLPADELPP